MAEDPSAGQLVKSLALGQRQGMIGGDLDEHVRHAHLFASLIEQYVDPVPRSVVDLGSGGGLPALVLIARWPASEWLLVEVRDKRALFLQRAIRMLDASDRVDVWSGDAQIAGGTPEWHESADLVTARAFGLPSLTAECASNFLRPGGHLVVSEPPDSSQDTNRWPIAPLHRIGLSPEVLTLDGARFCLMTKHKPDEALLPRSRKAMESSPLF